MEKLKEEKKKSNQGALCQKTNLLLNEIPVLGQDKELYLYIVMKKPRVQSVFQKVRVIRL